MRTEWLYRQRSKTFNPYLTRSLNKRLDAAVAIRRYPIEEIEGRFRIRWKAPKRSAALKWGIFNIKHGFWLQSFSGVPKVYDAKKWATFAASFAVESLNWKSEDLEVKRHNTTKIKPIPVNEVLIVEFMVPLGLSVREQAKNSGLPQKHVNELWRNRRALTIDTAQVLGRLFGNSADFWMSIQRRTDRWETLVGQKHEMGK